MGKKLNLTATLCIVLLFATLTSSSSGHAARRSCGFLDRVECDEPGNLTDGTVSYSKKGFEATVFYSCSSGFKLVGLSARTCLSNGSWSGTMPTCVFAGCGPLSGPSDHGYLSVTGQLLGHTATTFCDNGYEVTGSKNRTCLESGWSGSPADCVRVSCPAPSNPQFGSMSTPKGTEFEDEAIYECNEGFEMVGNSRRCCQSTGSWSDTAPNCKQIVTCPALLAPSNGTVSVSGPQQIGSTALYTCTYGLNTGNLERSCLRDGSWSGSQPTCSQACPSLSPPLNGDLSVTGLSINDKATISCDVGYVITGPTERSCTSSGWDGSAADCAPISCLALSNPQYGSMSTPKGTEFEDEAIYECNEGFEMVGNSRRRCQSTGSWSGTAPTCKQTVTCPALLAPSNGTVSVSGPQQIGSTALYTCTYGLNTGNLERSCLGDGSWSGSQPTCSQACPSLSPPLNGDLSVTGLSIDAKATISCDVGYVIAGPTERSCTSSGWDGSAADCVPVSCPSLSNPQYGSVSTPKWSEFEDEAIYECKRGFELVGNSRRYCRSTGSWSGTAPTCKQIVQCSALMDPDDGAVDVSGPQPIGSTATFSCEFGLVSGSLVRYCLGGGIWSGMDPICVAACPSLSPPLNGDLIVTGLRVGHSATFTCDVGFVITGSAVRSCTSSGWDGSAADCAPIACPKLSNPCEGSVSTPNGTEFEDEAIYECKRGFELVGNSRRYCRSTGSWSGTAPTCKQIACPTLSNPRDGSVSTPYGTEIREEAIYECKQGFELVGNSRRYCRSTGSWSGTAPTCKQIDCGKDNLPQPTNGVTTLDVADVATYGATATQTCNPGYTPSAEGLKLSCLDTGLWEHATLTCTIKNCWNPPILANGFVQLDGSNTTTYDAVATLNCNEGHETQSNQDKIKCLETGEWAEITRVCTKKDCGKDNLPQPNNGVTTLDVADVATYGATATQTCNPGYTPSAEGLKLSCLDTGLWEHATLTCTIKNCGAPPILANGDVQLDGSNTTTYDAVATLNCNEGHETQSNQDKINCLETGQWAEITRVCTKTKGFPGLDGLPGQQGYPGAKGEPGQKGVPGQSIPGEPGIPGERGRDGLNGRKGDKGLAGLPGRPGNSTMGRRGPAGDKGIRGPQGNPGLDGLPGLPGRDGSKGDRGGACNTCFPGMKGKKGDAGLPGLPGAQGIRGAGGPVGQRGEPGFDGMPGQQGPIGLTGMKGDSGEPGLPGLPGEDAFVPIDYIKYCSDPPVPTHGSVTLAVDGVTTYNSEATQSCDTGYSLSGEESIRCTADGSWSSSPVVCTKKWNLRVVFYYKNCTGGHLPAQIVESYKTHMLPMLLKDFDYEYQNSRCFSCSTYEFQMHITTDKPESDIWDILYSTNDVNTNESYSFTHLEEWSPGNKDMDDSLDEFEFRRIFNRATALD